MSSWKLCFGLFCGIAVVASIVLVSFYISQGIAIHRFVKTDDYAGLNRLLERSSTGVNAKDSRGFTPLMRAAQRKQGDIVKLLLKNGAKASIKSSDPKIPTTALQQTNAALHACGNEYKNNLAEVWKRAGATDSEIVARLAEHNENYGADAKKKWEEIAQLLRAAIQNEK